MSCSDGLWDVWRPHTLKRPPSPRLVDTAPSTLAGPTASPQTHGAEADLRPLSAAEANRLSRAAKRCRLYGADRPATPNSLSVCEELAVSARTRDCYQSAVDSFEQWVRQHLPQVALDSDASLDVAVV